jgi:hypothetical protein
MNLENFWNRKTTAAKRRIDSDIENIEYLIVYNKKDTGRPVSFFIEL